MKRFITLAITAATMAAVPTVADAQAWQSINARQANQFNRINQGVRNGALTQAEAAKLRSDFYALERLEQQYRRDGLSLRERQDLDRRFDDLSRRIYVQKNDRQTAGSWTSINARQANQFNRIEQGLRDGALTPNEAAKLRAEFYGLERLEQQYRLGGLTLWERQDLDRRFNDLSRRIYVQKNDRQGAAPWTPINARQADQFNRINQGVRNGALTAAEATRLRSEFYALERLEQRYRIGGLSLAERQDLDRRFNDLSRRIYVQKHDRQDYRR